MLAIANPMLIEFARNNIQKHRLPATGCLNSLLNANLSMNVLIAAAIKIVAVHVPGLNVPMWKTL